MAPRRPEAPLLPDLFNATAFRKGAINLFMSRVPTAFVHVFRACLLYYESNRYEEQLTSCNWVPLWSPLFPNKGGASFQKLICQRHIPFIS